MAKKGSLAKCPHCGGQHRSATAVKRCKKRTKGLKWTKTGNTYVRK